MPDQLPNNDASLPDVDPARVAEAPDVDWSDFNPDNDDSVVSQTPTEPVAPGTPPPQPTPAASPSAVPPPPAPAPVQGIAPAAPSTPATPPSAPPSMPVTPGVPGVSTAAVPPVTPPAPSVQPTSPVPPAPSLEEQRAARKAQLLERYAISAEQVPALLVEPDKVLPELLATAHENATAEVLQMLGAALPQVILQTLEQNRVEAEAKRIFFTAWPELAPFEAQVGKIAEYYRSTVKPQATHEEALQGIGEMAMAALGITRQAPAAPGASSPASGAPAGGFRPAGTSTPVSAPVSSKDTNVFTQLVEEWDKDS